jgi:cbb3-type cytochrome oxidase subunit 3
MGLVREYLVSIAGVHIFAIIALVIFLAVFIFMVAHAYSLNKDEVSRYSQLPLDDDDSGQVLDE